MRKAYTSSWSTHLNNA